MGGLRLVALLCALPVARALTLASFDLDLFHGLLTLRFSAAVRSASFNASAVTLSSSAAPGGPRDRYTLTGMVDGVYDDSDTSNFVFVPLSQQDYVEILWRTDVAVDAASTWLTLSAGCVVSSVAGTRSFRRSAVNVLAYTPDTLPPTLLKYALDMDSGHLAMLFDEPMNRSRTDLDFLLLMTAESINDVSKSVQLQNAGSRVLGADCEPASINERCTVEEAMWVNVSLGGANLDAIKARSPLATAQELTYLSITGAAARDHAGTGVSASFWSEFKGRRPFLFRADETPPALRAFDLDMDAGTLTLHFSETVDASELDVGSVTLQEALNSSVKGQGLSHALVGGPGGSYVAGLDAAILQVRLSKSDFDELKRLPRLAANSKQTFLSAAARAFRDNAALPNFGAKVPKKHALPVSDFVPDETAPQLEGCSLDMTRRTVTFAFTETVNATSLDASLFGLQSARRHVAGASAQVPLRDARGLAQKFRGSSARPGAAVIVTLDMGAADFAAVKLAADDFAAGAFAFAAAAAVFDTRGNALVAVTSKDAVRCAVFADDEAAKLVDFALDMDSGVLALFFDEPVSAASLDLKKVEIVGGAASGAAAVRLGLNGGNAAFAPRSAVGETQLGISGLHALQATLAGGEVLYVGLDADDLDALKVASGVGDALQTTWLRAEKGWVGDYPPRAVSEAAPLVRARAFAGDATRPKLLSFELDLDAGTFTLVADEALGAVNASDFVFMSAASNAALELRLDAYSAPAKNALKSRRVVVKLHRSTLDALKLAPLYGRFLALKGSGGADAAGNALEPFLGRPRSQFTPDTTPPKLVAFEYSRTWPQLLTLRFDEPVAAATLSSTAWQLQSARLEPGSLQPLAGVAVENGVDSRTLVCALSAETRLDLLSRRLGQNQADTFLRSRQAGAASDVAGNALEAMQEAMQLGPRLVGFDLDMDTNQLRLHFSGPVDALKVDAQSLALQANEASVKGDERLRLSAQTAVDVVRGSKHQALDLTLTLSDVASLRLQTSLTRGTSKTFLVATKSLARDVVQDVGPNALVEDWTADAALRASHVLADATPPTLLHCDLDLDANRLVLTFDEAVRAATLHPHRVELRDARHAANATVSVRLSAGSLAFADGSVLTVQLSGPDSFAIKGGPPLGQEATFCALDVGAIEDCGAGVALGAAATVQETVLQVRHLRRDTSAAVLVDFYLDLNTAQLVLTFDEPINCSSVDAVRDSVTLSADRSDAAPAVRLSCTRFAAETPYAYNSTVRLKLCVDDLLLVQATTALCRFPAACFLSHGAGLALDAARPSNMMASLAIAFGLEASNIIADTTAPVLVAVAIDLDVGTCTLTFDEVVDPTSVDVDGITLQSASFTDGVGSRTLSAALGTAVSYAVKTEASSVLRDVTVKLGRDDLDAVKALQGVGLATCAASTFLSLHPGAVSDVFRNGNAAVFDYAGFGPAAKYVADSTPPRLLAFSSVSKTNRILYALFDEPIDHERVNLSAWRLQSEEAAVRAARGGLGLDDVSLGVRVVPPGESIHAPLAAATRAPYSTTVALALSGAYAEARATYSTLNTQADSFLALAFAAVSDAAGNELRGDAAHSPGAARATMLGPQVEAFALDMDAGVVLLSLTQKVLALDATKVVLVSFSGASVASVRLGAPSFVEGVSLGNADAKVSAWQLLTAERRPLDAVGGETQVRIVLAEDDVWRLQRAGFGLGKRARATYLAVDALAARTPAFSVAVASPLSVARRLEDVALSLDPSAFRPDQTAPTLRGFGVDMQAGTLYLNFSEPVRLASLNVSGLRLGAMQFQEGVALEDSAVAEEDAVYAECGNSAGNRSRGCSFAAVRLGARDVDAVKAQRAGDWISADAGVARDLALPGNAMLSLDKALYRALFVKDTWPPNLETWGLDLDRGLVHLNLSEPVDPQSLNASRMLLGNAHGEVRLREAESHQRAGTKELVLVLGRDLLPLKALLAAAPGANSTFLSAAEGFVADMAFPAPANFARGSSILARFVVPDRTGPRLFGFEVDVPNLVVRLYFNEPVLAEINASALVFRNVNSFAATSVRLSDSAGAVGAFGCEVRIDLSNQDASRMTANGIGEKAYLEHDGGVCRDASGNAAVAGAGPGVVDATFEKVGFAAAPAGLAADSALAAGPVVAAFRLDMDSGAMKVTLYHPMRHAVNVTSLSLASTDSGFAYALTANSTATVEVDYGDAGDVVFTVQLSLEDVLGVKLADGGLGAAPLASLASNTFLAVGSAFARSSTSFKTVPRQVDSALGPVATVEFFPDVSAPKLVSVQVDMNTGRVTFLWDEPVRAAEADVGKVWFSGAASAQTAGRTLTDSLSLSRGASLTVQIQLGAADLNEMKRRDGLATGLNDTFYGFNFGTFVDRAAGAGNPADAVVLARAVDGFLPDVTDAIFESYDVDLQACTLTLRFIEPMVVASFNATAVTVQESDFADTGQRYRLGPDSYASATSDSTASQTLVVALSENDCAGINIESRLAKSIDTTRITMEPEAARDVAGNRVTRIYDGAGMAPSAYTPDSTPPQLLRFWIDVDRGTLTFNFTEPVLFGSFVATRFSLQSGSTGSVMQLRTISRAASLEKWLPLYGAEDPAYAADDSFASFYGAGATVTVTLARQDVLLLQSRPLIAADRDSTWLAAVPGGFQDMSGNPLLKTAQRAAFFVPDTTRPALERFDLDMDAGQLVLYFSEAPNLETLDMAKFLVCAGACVRLFAEATSAVSQGLATVDPDVLTFAAGPALHDALRTARIGITTAFIAADEGAVEDAVGLPLVRLLPPNVAAQRDPLRVHSLVCDTTGPALRRATYSGGELRLYFDEPVDADSAQAALVTVGRLGAVFALDATTAVTSPSPRVLAFDLARDCLLFEHEACPASPDTVPASPDAVNQTCRGLCDSARADALLEAGGALFVAAAEGAVEDYGDNPSLRYSAFSSPPSCACADGAYIAVACNAFDDAVCAACSVECRAGFFQTSDCGEFADVGCSRCTPCGFPFFAAGGCTGVLDTECAACTACTEVEYEVSQCAAGADRTCETCQTDQECVEPSAQCEDTAKWWRQENCCLDADGDRISCNARAEAALRIAARNGRRHWVFDQTFPAVEAGFDQGALLP